MDEPHIKELRPFSTIGLAEKITLNQSLKTPLSGYLGGVQKAGYWVERLQDSWRDTFQCKHAITCSSATSGLLAACMAIGIKPGDTVWTSAYTMSASAACAKVLGANIVFIDIETMRFSMNMNLLRGPMPKCIIVTNLFGHPAYLAAMRTWCDSNRVVLIEDNAQSPFATENGRYAGTIGHIGVFSLNVHKHIQCGEGGVVVTNDIGLAVAIGGAINHGELAGYSPGLNLRMTEPIAAIAVAQLAKAPLIIKNRIEFANEMSWWFRDLPWLEIQQDDISCRHVRYVWAARVTNGKRKLLVDELNKRNFPMKAGYAAPLHRIFDKEDNLTKSWPVVDRMEDEELITFEICRYDPMPSQRKLMAEVAKRVTGEMT